MTNDYGAKSEPQTLPQAAMRILENVQDSPGPPGLPPGEALS